MVRTNIPTVHILLVFAAREAKDGPASGIFAGLDIALGVTHEIRVAGRINGLVDRLERLDDVPDPGLAAVTTGGRLTRTIKNIINSGAGGFNALEHMGRDPRQLVPGENPFTDTRLIRDHKNMIPGIRQLF